MIEAFAPSFENGRKARHQIQARLAESVGHILERCRGKVPFDEATGASLIEILKSDHAVRPDVFSAYFLVVRAIMLPGLEPDDDRRSAIEGALRHLLSEPFRATHSITVRPLSPAYFNAAEEQEARGNFVSESLQDTQIVTVDETTAGELSRDISHALSLIRDHAPKTWAEFEQCICEIIPTKGRNSAEGLEFGGCSSLERWGSTLVNTSAQSSTVALCESLIHEAAHNFLFGSSPVEFHVRNSPEERYRSPLRVDPRPLDGIFHATFVLARMCFGMNELAASPSLPQSMRQEARDRADDALGLFWDGYAVLDKHANYTDEGRAIMSAGHAYMAAFAGSKTA